MVENNHVRWDFIGLSTDTKPTPADSENVTNGSTFYCSDTSKLYVWYNDQWYEKQTQGGGGGGPTVVQSTGTSTTDVMSQNAVTLALADKQDTLTAGSNITISDNTISATDTTYTAGTNVSISANNEISATDTTYSDFTGTDGTAAGTAGLVPAPATTDAGKFLKADGTWDDAAGSTYTAGDGIDITNDVISATNTGKARVLTTDDYNYDPLNTGTNTAIALWMLNPGIYKIAEGNTRFYYNTTDNEAPSTSGRTFIILGTDNNYRTIINETDSTSADILVHKTKISNGNNAKTYYILGGDDIVQTTGTSTTDVMSQNAVTSMVFELNNPSRIKIGTGGSATQNNSITLGQYVTNYGLGAVAIGWNANASSKGSVALGAQSKADGVGVVSIGGMSDRSHGYNNSQYRLLTGLYDGQSAHDAATVGQITPTTDSSAPTSATVGRLGEIRIDTTTNTAYMCVVSDSTTPVYEWKQITT